MVGPDPHERRLSEGGLAKERVCATRGGARHADLVARDQDHDRRGMGSAQTTDRLEAVHPRHPGVDEHEIGVDRVGDRDSLLPGGSLAEELDARRRLDHLARGTSEDLLVVDGHHTDARTTRVRNSDQSGSKVATCSPIRNRAGMRPVPRRTYAGWGGAHGVLPSHEYRGGVAIRVVVADDNLFVREGLGQVLRSQPGLAVVASCGDLPSLLETVESTRPDVVLTDIRMPPSRSDEGI